MTITEITRKRAALYAVELDGEQTVMVDCRAFDESGYGKGAQLSEDALERLLAEANRRRARERALYLLSVKSHSRAGLAEKLREETDAETADATARQMEELGLVNDEAYACRLAEEMRLVRHYSLRRTVQELRRRGLDRDVCEQAAQAVDTTDEEQALALLSKKRYNKDCDEKTRRRTADLLLRNGYGYNTVRRVMQEYEE